MSKLRVGLLGFGEVGKRFGSDLRARGVESVATYDLLLEDPMDGKAMQTYARQHGIALTRSAHVLVERSDLIICAVTAAQALAAVHSLTASSLSGKWVLDVNSASPETKRECGRL